MTNQEKETLFSKIQVFEDNGGGITIAGRKEDGSYNIMTGLEAVALRNNGLWDITHFDDLDQYDGDVEKELDDLAYWLNDPMGSVWCVAEYDGDTIELHKEVMCASLRYFGF